MAGYSSTIIGAIPWRTVSWVSLMNLKQRDAGTILCLLKVSLASWCIGLRAGH